MKTDRRGYVTSDSKKHDKLFTYWWDIAPSRRTNISLKGGISFVQRDTNKYALVKAADILPLLTPERQTTRAGGVRWGIKVLSGSPNKLVVEQPGMHLRECRSISVTWV